MKKSSSEFSPQKPPKSDEEEHIQTLCKQMLKAKVFKGVYQERRYVDGLAGYRDLIQINNSEDELKGDLKYLRQRINKFYNDENLWIGISLPDMIGTPAGVCIWTEVSELALGEHVFCVKSVKFRHNEVIIKVRVVPQKDQERRQETEPDETKEFSVDNLFDLLVIWRDSISKSVLQFLSQDISKENIATTFKFICLLMLSLAAASVQAIKFVGLFSLRFIKEFRMLLHTCTPIILKIIDLLAKVIGGLFIMLTMVYRDIVQSFRGTHPQVMAQHNYASISGAPYQYRAVNRRQDPRFH